MDYAQGNAIVVIDADLQDPPELILDMIEKWREGYEVVYAVRTKRKGETFFKKQTAALFYRLLSSMTDIDIPIDTGDFRLMDRKVCDEMKRLKEKILLSEGSSAGWASNRQRSSMYAMKGLPEKQSTRSRKC